MFQTCGMDSSDVDNAAITQGCFADAAMAHLEQGLLAQIAALKEFHSLSATDNSIPVLIGYPEPVVEEVYV